MRHGYKAPHLNVSWFQGPSCQRILAGTKVPARVNAFRSQGPSFQCILVLRSLHVSMHMGRPRTGTQSAGARRG